MDRERLKQNLENVRQRVAAAAERAGRKPSGVTLIAVTKSVDVETTRALIELGVKDIAENRAQAAEDKLPHVRGADDVRKHFIGPLQRNKINKVLQWADCVHSVDSVKLAEAIDKRVPESGRESLDVFVQINIAGEDQKGGLALENLGDPIEAISRLGRLRVIGLMCMAPYDEDTENVRKHFRHLAHLSHALRDQGLIPGEATALSMGMSGDFEVAVEEGATHIRVGSALFEGVRD